MIGYMLTSHQGNLEQMFGHNGWDYMQNMCMKYGPVMKVNGFFGVCRTRILASQDH